MKRKLFIDYYHLIILLEKWDKKYLLEFMNRHDFIIAMDTETKSLLKELENQITD